MSFHNTNKENETLKKQLALMKKSADFYKNQLDGLQKQVDALQKQLQQKNDYKTTKKAAPQSKPPILIKKKEGIVTSISRNDAANALLAKFASKKTPSASKLNNQNNKNIVGSVNRNDAANALLAKFGAAHTPKPIKSVSNNKATFRKYETMLKIGVDLPGVLTQMKKDNISSDLITKFMKSHGGSAETEEKQETDPIKLGLPRKPTIKPTNGITMKRLHWEPIKLSKIKESMWNKVDQTWSHYKAVTFELKFQVRKQKPKLSKDALKCGVNDVDEKKQTEKVKFASDKRSQQVQIGLRSYHMSNQQLRQMILALDDTKLDIDSLRALIDIIPSVEEQLAAERASQNHKITNFGITERFFYSLYDMVEITPRFKKWLFMLQFDGKCDKLEDMITMVEKGKTAITRSQSLRDIFGILLAFGNHMNHGNKRGNCYGFHLSALSLLPQIKTFDNSMSFPMFLYDFIWKTNPKLLDIIQQFTVIGQAQHITRTAVDAAYEELVVEVKDLNAMIERYKDEYVDTLSVDDKFLDVMQNFAVTAKKRIWKLKFKYDSFQKCEKKLIKYFAYGTQPESGKVTINKIFADIYAFVDMLQSAKIKLDILQQRRKKKALKKKKRSAKHRRRKSDENVLTKMNRFRKNSMATKPKTKFAMGLDDIGTPLAEQQKQQLTFTQMVLTANTSNDDNKSQPMASNKSSKYRYKIKPKAKKTKPNVTIVSKLPRHSRGRRNSDPTSPSSPPRPRPMNWRVKSLAIENTYTGTGLVINSSCKLTPCVDIEVDDGYGGHHSGYGAVVSNRNKYRNGMAKKGKHKYKKSKSDITAVLPQNIRLKKRGKIAAKRAMPSKGLPTAPMNARKPKRLKKKPS